MGPSGPRTPLGGWKGRKVKVQTINEQLWCPMPLGCTLFWSHTTLIKVVKAHHPQLQRCTVPSHLLTMGWIIHPLTKRENLYLRSLGTTPISGKTLCEKVILGALGEFRGILGATLGIGNSILGIRNSILGMAPHDLGNTKTTILGATPGAIPGIGGNPHERSSFAPSFSERFFENWGGPREPDYPVASRQCGLLEEKNLKVPD